MKKIDLGQAISILANVGVIAGIVFLGLELRQNNQLLAASARTNLITQRASAVDQTMNPFVLEALYKYAAGEPVTPAERGAIFILARQVIELWEWQYGEYVAGMLDREELPVEAWRQWFR